VREIVSDTTGCVLEYSSNLDLRALVNTSIIGVPGRIVALDRRMVVVSAVLMTMRLGVRRRFT